ncbi:MAG: glycosyltransferase family 2 protein [Candidatus Nanoarchaeia archaeon]|nr:glycosyltransferase family 2 protein [Candidatus Nanoarchaeia archaeon]
MIHIIITAYGEPKSTEKAVKAFLNQNIKQDYDIIVCDPFEEVKNFITEKFKDYPQVKYYEDPGEGKAYALNLLINQYYSDNKDDIFIFTDGDVYVNEKSVNAILKSFEDKEVGAVTTKIVSLNPRNNMLGYWSHLLIDGANKTRNYFSKRKEFFECSGYLFAIKNGILKEFPEKASEDAVIPALMWKKGYKIAYVNDAEVFVMSPSKIKEWLDQKKRNIKGHESLNKVVKWEGAPPRTKSFVNEIKFGSLHALTYPRNLKEVFWTFVLFYYRLKLWYITMYDLKFKKEDYKDGWREEENLTTTRLEE